MKLTTVNPVIGRKKVKETPREVKLNVEDVKKIMDHADDHVKWAMEVNFNLGLRSGESELLALKWEHIDFDKREVTAYAPKTRTKRLIPISEAFAQKLKSKMEEGHSEYVIEFKGRGVLSIAKGVRHAAIRAGITYPVRMYDLRHLFASTMLAKGADLAAVSKLMGHASIKMTADVYYHAMHGEKERAIGLLPELAVA
jgi:integrase